MLKKLKRFFEMHGLAPIELVSSLTKSPRFVRDYNSYKSLSGDGFPLKAANIMPVLNDYDDNAGVISGHYVHQDLWAAKKIFHAAPKRHVDIGSRIDGFVTSLLSYREVEVVDIRPLTSPYDNLIFIQDDATQMNKFQDNELSSVSCLHAMEHFGLGRYGDPIQPDAYKIFAQALARVIKKEGILYLSVPIGQQRVEFNAHRIFNPQTILDLFPEFRLNSFAAINDEGHFVAEANLDHFVNSSFSCGLFEFEKC